MDPVVAHRHAQLLNSNEIYLPPIKSDRHQMNVLNDSNPPTPTEYQSINRLGHMTSRG